MSTQVQLRRSTTADHATFTGAAGEVTVDTTKNTAVVHDGSTAGGHPLAKESALASLQPLDADLTAIAALSSTGLVERTGSGTAAIRALGVGASTSVPTRADADARYAAASHGHTEADITVSAPSVVGRKTAGAGTCEELTASDVLDLIGTTRGSVLCRGASGWTALSPGTSGYVLTSNGAGADPSYQVGGGGDGGTPGGSAGQVQYNDSGAFAGASKVETDGSSLILVANTAPAPSSGRTGLSGGDLGGRVVPVYRGASGAAQAVAQHFGTGRIAYWLPRNNSATPDTVGMALTSAGTLTARSVAGGSFFSGCRRVSMVSAATAGQSAAFRSTSTQVLLGDAAGVGGFHVVAQFAIADAAAVADARMFVGLASSTTLSSTNPSGVTNIIGVGCDSAETTLSVMHNDGSGTATKISLGANFPCNTQSTDVYELNLYAAPNASSVGYRVVRLNTGDTASGILSTDLPAGATMLAPHAWRNNGSTALAVDLALMGFVIETDH